MHPSKPFFLWRHLNKLRWASLIVVALMLILIPFLHLYQTYNAAHAYDLLAPSEKRIFDVMEFLTDPFTSDPAEDLDALKGTTWSGTFWGLRLSDPLAPLAQMAASLSVYWPFALTALIPIVLTAIFGRFFCGWICPANLIYELNGNLAAWLRWAGFGAGMVFFLGTLLFDLLVSRRGFCRYLCPGGALYSLLGRYRALRIQRIVESCNDCAKCNVVCEFGLDPLRDGFGQECTNCAACIAVCPTDALTFTVGFRDHPAQGPGHLGRQYKRESGADFEEAAE